MKLRFITLAAALIGIFTSASAFDFVANGVYRIDQAYDAAGYRGKSMSAIGAGGITLSDSNSGDEKQLWVMVPDENHTGYYFRNYVTGFYMASPIAKNEQWYTTTPENLNDIRSIFTTSERPSNGGDNLIFPVSIIGTSDQGTQNGYAHAKSEGYVICFGTGAAASGWRFTQINKTPEEVAARMERWGLSPVERNAAYTMVNSLTGKALVADPATGAISATADVNPSDPAQLWVTVGNTSGTAYYLRNYLTGHYITSPLALSTPWTASYSVMPVENSMAFKIDFSETGGDGAVIFPLSLERRGATDPLRANGYAVASADGSVTGGTHDAPGAGWVFGKAENITPDMIAERSKTWYTYAKGIVDGHVYRIVNVGYGHAMTAPNKGVIRGTAIDTANEAQLWVAIAKRDGDGYYLRNLANGYYMYSPRTQSGEWNAMMPFMLNDANVVMNFVATGSNHYIIPVSAYGKTGNENTYGNAHENAAGRVVGWDVNSENSKWTFVEETSMTPAQVEAKMAAWPRYASDITPGLYRITNINYNTNLATNGSRLRGLAPDASDLSQVWYVENHPDGDGYVIRNYANGRPVVSPRAQSQAWSLADKYYPDHKSSAMYFNRKNDGFGITNVSTYGTVAENKDFNYAHLDNTNTVVGWEVNSAPSRWMFQPATDITDEEFEAKHLSWEIYGSFNVESALAAIFTDAACTQLTPEYAAKTAAELDTDPNVLALPEGLRPMVLKTLTGDWSETDPFNGKEWDSTHAKKMRVQMIEPYSECGWAATLAGIQAYTDVNNPTGILSDNGTVLYVMVDKEPQDGSTLYIAGRTGEGSNLVELNSTTDGFRLRKGLNVITCAKDTANMIVYYTVATAGGNRTRRNDVTTYEDIKIHIEGGSLNGYFNAQGDELYTPDTNEDWLYYRDRARHPMFNLISKYTSLYIHFDDIFDENGNRTQCLKTLCSPEAYAAGRYDLIKTMKAWDEIYMAETMLMGLHSDETIMAEKAAGHDYYDTLAGDPIARNDYHKYFNNRFMGITLRVCAFMNATWYRTAYNPSTISSIIREIPTGDIWGTAHEFGHLNQGPINIVGSSEESNNVFSNVSLFYRGTNSSRADFPSVQRARFNRGENFHQHDTWGTTRMWFQLWLYYHAVGHNKKFYPRLFELLRTNPLRRVTAPGHPDAVNPIYAKYDLLHFAKMCCLAAGEDLTDFFEAWGFMVPQDAYYIGDYTSYTTFLTPEDIAEWKQEIKTQAAENGWRKNSEIIFIDDRVGSTKESYGGFDKNRCGTMGGLNDFINGAPVSGDYSFTISGNTVKIEGGTGGVGFLIHDAEGKLIGFANETTFEVSPEAAALIKAGEVTVSVSTPDAEPVAVVDAVHDGTLEQRLAAMDVMIDKAKALLAKSDPDGRKLGYFKPEVMAALREAYDNVKALRDNGGITAENNVALYDALHDQYLAHLNITATAENTIGVVPGGTYTFVSNILHNGKGITTNAQGTQLAPVNAASVDPTNEAQQWVFEPAGEDDYYLIRNVKNGKYIGKAAADKAIVTLQAQPMKQLVLFRQHGGFSISPLGSDHDSLHDDGNGRITRWDSSASASRWTLQQVDGWGILPYLADLNTAINRVQALLNRAGTVTATGSTVTAVPSADYSLVSPEMMIQIYLLISEGRELAFAPTDADELEAMTAALNSAYDELTAAMDSNRVRLADLIDKTRELINTLATVDESVEPIALTGDLLHSNAYHTAAGGDKFTTWDVLLDGNPNTFFHSTYSANTTDGLDHYIRIELPEVPVDDTPLIFEYVTRKNTDSNWFPAEASLQYSADGQTWENVTRLSAELPFVSAGRFESDPFTVPAGTRYVRFMVHKNRQSESSSSRSSSNGHDFFVLSEIGLNNHTLTCDPNTADYPEASEGAIKEAVTQAHIAQKTLSRPRYANPHYDAAYEALLPHYENLMAIAQGPTISTGIEEVTIGEDNTATPREDVIYTLGGIRIKTITQPGFYIVNGKKVVVR